MSKVLAGLGLLGAAVAASKKRRGLGEAEAGREIFYRIVPKEEIIDLYERLEKEDEQSATLLLDVVQRLQEKMDIDRGAKEALSRVVGVVRNRKAWDASLIRNNVFKAANSLGMKLPSHYF